MVQTTFSNLQTEFFADFSRDNTVRSRVTVAVLLATGIHLHLILLGNPVSIYKPANWSYSNRWEHNRNGKKNEIFSSKYPHFVSSKWILLIKRINNQV